MMVASRHVADAPVGELAVIRDLSCPGPAGEIRLRLYDARETREAGPLLLFLHGGGFVFGDLDTHEPFCAEMARELDMPVLAVDYRLAPEHPWPAGVEDAIAAARWAAASPAALGRRGDRPGRLPATAPAAISPSSSASRCATSRRRCRCSRNGRSIPPPIPARAIRASEDFGEGYMLTKPGMDWFERLLPAPTRRTGAIRLWSRARRACRRPSSSPPASIRSATRAAPMPPPASQAGVPTIFREAEGNIHGFINLRKADPLVGGGHQRLRRGAEAAAGREPAQ